MIGSSPSNPRRRQRLLAMHAAGYRGPVSATAYYACDRYEVTDDGVRYVGRYRYGAPGYMPQNFSLLYKQYVTHPGSND